MSQRIRFPLQQHTSNLISKVKYISRNETSSKKITAFKYANEHVRDKTFRVYEQNACGK